MITLRKYAAMIGCLMLATTSSCVSGTPVGDGTERETYAFCNVFLSTACFGIAQGDELRMSIPADYVRYDVKLGERVSGVVYYGYNPNVVASDLASEFEDCASTVQSCGFIKQYEGGIEAVYSGSREENVVHVLLDGVNGSNRKQVQEFMKNFRPCRGSGADVVCRETAIFQIKGDGGN